MSELKPCPFCGHAPMTYEQTGLIACSYSMCGVNPESFSDEDWNNRTQPTISDYLAQQKPMLDKTGAKVVTVKSLVDFMEKGDEKDSAN